MFHLFCVYLLINKHLLYLTTFTLYFSILATLTFCQESMQNVADIFQSNKAYFLVMLAASGDVSVALSTLVQTEISQQLLV